MATIGSQVLSVTSTPQLLFLPTSLPPPLPPFCHWRDGICYGEGLTALRHISLNATLPAVTIRKEHMPGPGTTTEELLYSSSFLSFCPLQYRKVCIWCDCGSHLNRTEMWFCLADSNASQMDPITCLIVATSCPPTPPPPTSHLSPASQMRQSYRHSRPFLYIQGLLTGGCCTFCPAVNSNEAVLFVLLCRLERRQIVVYIWHSYSSLHLHTYFFIFFIE